MTATYGMASNTLQFPNVSRSFDAEKNRIRFWGYDSAIEITFFVETTALEKLDAAQAKSESGYLATFDAARDQILAVAERIYTQNKVRSYAHILTAQDF